MDYAAVLIRKAKFEYSSTCFIQARDGFFKWFSVILSLYSTPKFLFCGFSFLKIYLCKSKLFFKIMILRRVGRDALAPNLEKKLVIFVGKTIVGHLFFSSDSSRRRTTSKS